MTFVGTFEHTIDAKGRLVLPAKFRGHLAKSAYLAPHGRCLALWEPQEFDSMLSRLREKARAQELASDVILSLTSASEEVGLDAQGRVLVSDRLRTFASLEREVVLLGAMDHVEIWDRASWEQQRPEMDALMTQALAEGLGV
ncbi:MAG: division/cell wall cluster transcriptional repressor MraZ [Acidimicrobiia bacterium]|nr:division/cell wall cluster transcriptional repressor MraZ [Acidimicrobiia bacterium]